MALDLRDSSGQVWRFGITDAGVLTSTLVASGSPSQPTLTDYQTGTTAWIFGVTTQGQITTTPAAVPFPKVTSLLLVSSSLVSWYLIVTNQGILQAASTPFLVGQLAGVDPSYPTPVQPGGIGTPVTMPTQQDGEKTGRFRFGCGHSFNTMEIRKVQSGTGQAALCVCPICSYVQRIITPYSEIFAFGNEILQA